MSETKSKRWTRLRQLVLYSAASLAVVLPLVITSSDLSGLLYFLAAVPIASIALGIAAFRRRGQGRLAVLALLVFFWIISGLIFRHFSTVRDTARWLLEAKSYKASVLALPTSPNGDFRHVEWDGWGFAGQDTTVYLVFDPNDSLLEPSSKHLSGKFSGVSCAVYRVHRLEKHWYTAAFYTDTAWGQCE